jgi:hypothetical protein
MTTHSPLRRRSPTVEENRDNTAAEIESEKEFLEENFGLSDETAEAAAKDRILGVAPAESSYEVELERIHKAQASDPEAHPDA